MKNFIRSIAHDIILYGDACLIPTLAAKGVIEIVQIEPRELQERIEFVPSEVDKKLKLYKAAMKYALKDYIEELKNTSSFSNYFKPFFIWFQCIRFF